MISPTFLKFGELFKQMGDGIENAAKVAGIRMNRYNNNNDGPTTINNARLMIQDKPDLILEYTGVEGIGAALKKMFGDEKIPFIAINIPIPGGYWFNLVNKEIGTDTANVVVPAAKAKGWTAADTTVLIVQGSQYGAEVNDCVRYFYVTAAKNMPGMEQVEPSAITALTTTIGNSGIQVDGKATLENSYTAVKNALQTLPNDRHILLYSINDELGARRLARHHRNRSARPTRWWRASAGRSRRSRNCGAIRNGSRKARYSRRTGASTSSPWASRS